MIFVTVGTQLPFPRLIDAMDRLAADRDEPVIAQVGPGKAAWPHLEVHPRLHPEQFETLFRTARLIVGHAGIGTILSARRACRPLVIVPRRHALGEHRNDHQLSTARQVAGLPGIHLAWQVDDLAGFIDRSDLPAPNDDAESPARAALIARLTAEIEV